LLRPCHKLPAGPRSRFDMLMPWLVSFAAGRQCRWSTCMKIGTAATSCGGMIGQLFDIERAAMGLLAARATTHRTLLAQAQTLWDRQHRSASHRPVLRQRRGAAALPGASGRVSLRGRPKLIPRACARLRPSPVRARISSRSNSASPPRTVSNSRPCGVVVSAQAFLSEHKAVSWYAVERAADACMPSCRIAAHAE
jgi:hypothetical protein